LTDLPLELIRGDVTSLSDLAGLCSGCEVVFNLAAVISIRKNDPACRKINVDASSNLIKAALSAGVRKIIHFSSIHAFDENPLNAELNETRALSFHSRFSYDRSKALGQQLMLEASSRRCEIVVLNPTAIIGPHDYRPSLLGSALIRFYQGAIPALIPGGYNWVDVRDVCTAALSAVDRGVPGTCYLLGGSWQSLEALAMEIYKQGGSPIPALRIPVWLAQLGAPVINLHALLTGKAPLYTALSLYTLSHSHRNISAFKAEKELGYTVRPFPVTIAETLAWFRDNHYL
jgi:dihydroflavonol-4-reductase